jgi:hypothetical protein
MALLLPITCFLMTQMGHVSPFWTFTFQEFFNDVKNLTIQWVLTPAIILWKFESPLGLQLPKWELTWECEGSFPHILLHTREHGMWLPSFIIDSHLCKPLFWSWAQGSGCDNELHISNLLEIIIHDHSFSKSNGINFMFHIQHPNIILIVVLDFEKIINLLGILKMNNNSYDVILQRKIDNGSRFVLLLFYFL